MLRFLIFVLFSTVYSYTCQAQVAGCTDPQATNFNADATESNGNCLYSTTSFPLPRKSYLPNTLEELSGMIWWDGKLWGHNDSGNGPWFFAFDSANGAIRKTVLLEGAQNIDWEDMAQDSTSLYIGDFGNNANGNRANLKIYIIPKANLMAVQDTIVLNAQQYAVIHYTYPDQTDFTPTGSNNTKWDCEAMLYHRGRLHLFTKNWVGNTSVHYSLPSIAGTYVAVRHDSLNTGNYMITGADMGAEDEMMLCSYTSGGGCALFLVFGFDESPDYFVSGNVRRINLPSALSTAQLEAICFVNGIRGFTGSERLRQSIFNIRPQIRSFSTYQWITDYYRHNPVFFASTGMLRYNTTTDGYEYFNGQFWQTISME